MLTKEKLIFVLIGLILTIGVIYFAVKSGESKQAALTLLSDSEPSAPPVSTQAPATPEPTSPPQELHVYITGAVVKPDVYKVPNGSRIEDVLELAGGETEEADLTLINLAKTVSDEEKIVVPKKGDDMEINIPNQNQGPVNINTATRSQLTKLPRIGKVTAEKIIEYRETNGAFQSVEEIIKVPGIGQKTYDAIKDNITV